MAVVYVKQTCAVGHGGDVLSLSRGQAWDSGADVVKANPGLFEAEPEKVEGRRRVERATAAPGEKRAVGRPRKAEPEA